MNVKKEGKILALTYADDSVQYDGKIMPAGTVACMALNISKEDLAAMQPLCQRIKPAQVTLLFPFVEEKKMEDARDASHSLIRIISRYEIFSFFAVPDIDSWLNKVFSMDAVGMLYEGRDVMSSGQMDDETAKKYGPAITLQILAPYLAHLFDAITQLQNHLAPFADMLNAQGQQRTREAYLTQFSQSFPEEIHLGDGSNSWMSLMNASIQYTAGKNEQNHHWQMRKHMHFVSPASMLRTDFFEGLSVGHAPRRCAICGRWFLATDARNTKYCGEINPEDPKGLTCRAIASKRGRAARGRAEDHPLNAPYKRCMNTIDVAKKRKKIDPDLAVVMKKLAKDKLQRAKTDPAYAKGPYAKEMVKKALMTEAEQLLQRP